MSGVGRSSSSPPPGPFGVASPSSSSAALLGLHGGSHIPGMPGVPPPGSASGSSMNAAHQSMAMAMAAHAAQAAGLASLRDYPGLTHYEVGDDDEAGLSDEEEIDCDS